MTGMSETDSCRLCVEEEELSEHLWLRCPAFIADRQRLGLGMTYDELVRIASAAENHIQASAVTPQQQQQQQPFFNWHILQERIKMPLCIYIVFLFRHTGIALSYFTDVLQEKPPYSNSTRFTSKTMLLLNRPTLIKTKTIHFFHNVLPALNGCSRSKEVLYQNSV